MEETWVTGIRDQCQAAEVAFFFKQWGGVNVSRSGQSGRRYCETQFNSP